MYIHRSNEDIIFRSFRSPLITGVMAPPGVGKSTLVNYYVSNHPEEQWVIINMGHHHERLRVKAGELRLLIEEKAKQKFSNKLKIWVVIEDIQKCPQAYGQIQVLYDSYKDQNIIKFILTAANLSLQQQGSSETLAGRIEVFSLDEFNLQETLACTMQTQLLRESIFEVACDDFNFYKLEHRIENFKPQQLSLLNALDTLLVWGGLPKVILSNDKAERINNLANYLQSYIEKDIRPIRTISDINLYHKLLEITAENTGLLREDSKILETLSCSRDTLKSIVVIWKIAYFIKKFIPI